MNEEEHESFQKMGRSGNAQNQEIGDIESSRGSRHSALLKSPANHVSPVLHSDIVREPTYRSSFGLRERLYTWFTSCFRCINGEQSFVSMLEDAERRSPASLSEDLKKLISDKILRLKICETSRLLLDPNVMHPFVKVHIVNKNTGCYIQNLEKGQYPAIYHLEQLTSYNKMDRRYESNTNDILLPFATACCNFRDLGNSKGIWNQKFFINYPAQELMNPDTLLLFQILDFNHQALLYRNEEDSYDRNNLYRVAWSFLRPVGLSKTHLGRQRLELYQYKFNPSSGDPFIGKSFIPDVYYDFLWSNHEKYEGFLTVQFNYCARPKYRIVGEDAECASNLFEEQKEDKTYLDKYQSEQIIQKQEDKPKHSRELLKFYRNRQICEMPKQLIYKLESEQLGCYRLKFIGNYLFAACSQKKNTIIKVFDLANGEQVMTLKGHRGVIYKLQVTPNEKILATAGSDHIVRIWNIPEYSGQFIDEDESEAFVIGMCFHTAAVYSVSLIHQPLQETLYALTCCFDGYLRLWECKLALKTCTISKEIPIIQQYRKDHVYPTASVVSEANFFIVGDSTGAINIFDFGKERLSLRCRIIPEELKNDMVLSIHILDKNHLMLQASDNLIYHFQLLGNKLRLCQSYAGAVFENELADCAISPDNKYLLSPSESGKPFMWDVFTGAQMSLQHLNLSLKKRLVCCDWHPKYNLVAISGFNQFCPVFIYGNVLSEVEMKLVSAQVE